MHVCVCVCCHHIGLACCPGRIAVYVSVSLDVQMSTLVLGVAIKGVICTFPGWSLPISISEVPLVQVVAVNCGLVGMSNSGQGEMAKWQKWRKRWKCSEIISHSL